MKKIGRNDPCPCGSGKKFKKCCVELKKFAVNSNTPTAADGQPKVSLKNEIKSLQAMAAEKKEHFRIMGVFIFFSTKSGNAWLLEASGRDALQVAADGEAIEPEIEESSEALEINWSYSFRFEQKKLMLKSYSDKQESHLEDCPTQQVYAATRKIIEKVSPEILESLHLYS